MTRRETVRPDVSEGEAFPWTGSFHAWDSRAVTASLVHHFLSETAAHTPDGEALVTHDPGGVRLGYGQVSAAAASVTAQLASLGVAKGDRVALLAHNGLEWVAAWFGALAAGAVAVPLNTAADPHSLVHYVTDAGARVLLHGPRFERVLKTAAPMLGDVHVQPVRTDGPPGTPVAVAETDAAAIIYTSGSTGRPRGAVLTHKNLVSNVRSIVSYLELTPADRVLVLLPFYYVYGLSLLHMTFASGGTVVVENRFQYPNVALDTLERERCTGLAGVPSTYAILMNRSTFGERLGTQQLASLAWATQAGGGMSPALTRQVMDAIAPRRLVVMYGATEASARLSYVPPAELAGAVGSIGRAIPGVELTVRRADGTACDVDEVGELFAQGDNIMQGYWGDPVETARVLGPHGYRTGDLARRDAAGRFWLVGRARDMLKVGGHRVAAREIEDAILEHPAVHECAVIGIPDELMGDRLRAYVVLKTAGAADSNALGLFLKERLPAYKIPGDFDLRDALPKNESGKIMKEALRAEAAAAASAPK
ncbi:MAG TPA: class I adenylate-forming enzyme family protein [Kofleriaceae bacterium]|nr:class I adenylate-forming enzyme family protein [Kofleriaceae bacterium]